MNKLSIPSADFRVLLIQLVLRLVHRLARTLQPHTKRAELVDDLLESTLKLERELKRNVTLDVTRVHKRVLWDALFSNRLPEWLQVDLMDCLREEEVKKLAAACAEFNEYMNAHNEAVFKDREEYGTSLVGDELPEDNPKEDLKEVPYDELVVGRWYLELFDNSEEELCYLCAERSWISGATGNHHINNDYTDTSSSYLYYELPEGMNFDD